MFNNKNDIKSIDYSEKMDQSVKETFEITTKLTTTSPLGWVVDTAAPYRIIGYTLNTAVITIPVSINGINITEVTSKTTTSIFTFPDAVTDINFALNSKVTIIGLYAFSKCINLKNVILPSSVITIQNYAFYNTGYTTNGFNIIFSDNITTIGNYAFQASSINQFILPSKLTTIGQFAFSYCYRIYSIHIPSAVTLIDIKAFYRCENLTQIVFYGTCPTVKTNAFNGMCILNTARTFYIYYNSIYTCYTSTRPTYLDNLNTNSSLDYLAGYYVQLNGVAQIKTLSEGSLFKYVNLFNDNDNNLTVNSNTLYRTISPTFVNLTTYLDQTIWTSAMNGTTMKFCIPPFSLQIENLNMVNEWASAFACTFGFDVYGFQAGYVVFFGVYGRTYLDGNGINHTYKFDRIGKNTTYNQTTAPYGGGWINAVYVKPSLLSSLNII